MLCYQRQSVFNNCIYQHNGAISYFLLEDVTNIIQDNLYLEQSTRTIVPCPLIVTAASLNSLTICVVCFVDPTKQTKTLFLVLINFLNSLTSIILSITFFWLLVLAKKYGISAKSI